VTLVLLSSPELNNKNELIFFFFEERWENLSQLEIVRRLGAVEHWFDLVKSAEDGLMWVLTVLSDMGLVFDNKTEAQCELMVV
jgi:hypothetical protein